MNKTTVLMAAVLAIATVLAAGLTCANEASRGGSADNAFNPQGDDDRECDFTGYFEFDENDD